MKALLFAITISALALACNNDDQSAAKTTGTVNQDSIDAAKRLAAEQDSANFTSIQWLDSVSQNKGTVKEGGKVDLSWRFKNVGDKPLVIAHASASCGCTTPEWPKEPVLPGAEGVIKAQFNSTNFSGHVEKVVTVRANTAENTYSLKFDLEVDKK